MEKTALLVMDYQVDILKLVESKAETLLKKAHKVIQAARQKKIPVIYVVVQFRPGYPEVSPRNKSFSTLQISGRMKKGTAGAEIHPEVAPLDEECVVVKHRVGALFETELQTILRGRAVEKLLLMGISTSGVMLSTLRHAADSDYGLTVISDCCADPDEEVHRILMEKIFPRQAEILSADQTISLLS